MLRSIGFAAAAAVFGFVGMAQAADDVQLQLDWTPGGISSAWYLGIQNGCFTKEGINLTVVRGYGAADAVTKVATGVAKFSITDLGTIISAVATSKAPVKAIMPVVSISPMGIAVLDDSPIKTLKDLEGHSIGSSVGNAAMTFLPIGMQIVGGDMSKVKAVTADGSALNGLLLSGQIDSLASYVTSTVILQSIAEQAGKKVRSIGYGDALDIYNASVFTSDAIIKDNPDLVARFVKGAECTYDAAQANPAGAVDAMVAGVEGMQKATQVNSVPFSMKFAFDNPIFKKNGYNWDLARVAHNIEIMTKVTPGTPMVKAEDVVYVVPK
ncbi:MAG: ABC transporter substrate-binding protein [Devosia sp.]|nr:ABC transporter substrate-binding protein [Devosia sp.]